MVLWVEMLNSWCQRRSPRPCLDQLPKWPVAQTLGPFPAAIKWNEGRFVSEQPRTKAASQRAALTGGV